MAERINVASDASVPHLVQRLTEAVESAGARVFTKVDFERGSASVGKTRRTTTAVNFGNPKIGAQDLQDGLTMALYLPLHIMLCKDVKGPPGPPMTTRQRSRRAMACPPTTPR